MAFEKYRSEVTGELKRVLGDSSPLFQMLRYHMGWTEEDGNPASIEHSGKLLRPAFCLMSCEAVGGDWQGALPAAAAIELIHNFSLIHDDIEDGSPLRRHRRTLWSVWGEPLAINAGDALHTLAEIALLGLKDRGTPTERIIEAMQIASKTCLRLCEGQHLDLSYEKRLDITIEDYLRMVTGKTAALFEGAFRLGALLGTADRTLIARLGSFGHYLGLAFQVADDVLGIWGGVDAGKSAESDLLKRKKTLPVVYALGRADGADRSALFDYYRAQGTSLEDIGPIRKLVEELGAAEYAKKAGRDFHAKALAELDNAGLSDGAKESLTEAASLVVEREF